METAVLCLLLKRSRCAKCADVSKSDGEESAVEVTRRASGLGWNADELRLLTLSRD
jgi:hypothetical protein